MGCEASNTSPPTDPRRVDPFAAMPNMGVNRDTPHSLGTTSSGPHPLRSSPTWMMEEETSHCLRTVSFSVDASPDFTDHFLGSSGRTRWRMYPVSLLTAH